MAIHDQNYVRYNGPLREGGGWWAITTMTLRLALSALRTKIILLLLWVMPLIMAVGIMIEYAVRGQAAQIAEQAAPGPGAALFFLQSTFFSLAILFIAAGCSVVSDDLRHRTFQLYFSRPLARWEYGLGKFLALFILGSFVSLVPALMLGPLRLSFFARTEFFNAMAVQTGLTLLMTTVCLAMLSAVVLGLSSLTRRTGYVVLSFIGVLLVPLILHAIVSIATGGADIAGLWSLPGNFMMISEILLNPEMRAEYTVPWWAPVLILLAVTGACVGALVRRIARLEGVA